VKLERYMDGNALRSKYVDFDWPSDAMNVITIDDFLSEFFKDPSVPFLRTYLDRASNILQKHVEQWFIRNFRLVQKADKALFTQMAKELRIDAKAGDAQVINSFKLSIDNDKLNTLFWAGVFHKDSRYMTLAQFIGRQ